MRLLELGDCLGSESCVDFRPLDDVLVADGVRNRDPDAPERQYPPRISSPPQSESRLLLPRWVMKKYWTTDGRLVIRKEMAVRHEYFRAHRADGRLVMSLVHLGDDEEDEDDGGGDECLDDEKCDEGDGSGFSSGGDGRGNVAAAAEVDGGEMNGEDERRRIDRTVEMEQCNYNRISGGGFGGVPPLPLST